MPCNDWKRRGRVVSKHDKGTSGDATLYELTLDKMETLGY